MSPRILAALMGLAALPAQAERQQVTALSLAAPEIVAATASGNGASTLPAPFVASASATVLSADGARLAFTTVATDLLAGVDDANGTGDVYVFDRASGTMHLASRSAADPARTANGASRALGLSKDGRRVVFASTATDLVAGQVDGNGADDVFLFDLDSGTVTLVSRRRGAPAITGNGASGVAVISADGQTVAFTSVASDITPLQDSNGTADGFWYTVATGATEPFAVSATFATRLPNGITISPELSADGSVVVFASGATDLVAGQIASSNFQLYVARRGSGVRMITHAAGNPVQPGSASTFAGSLSADGEWLAFESLAGNLVAGITDANSGNEAYVHELATDTTTLLSFAAGNPARTGNRPVIGHPLIDATGDRIAYVSFATDMIAGLTDTNSQGDLFIQERASGQRTLVSHRHDDANRTADHWSQTVLGFDASGKHLLYTSVASDLVAGQTDVTNTRDLFFYSLSDNLNRLVSAPAATPTQAGRSGEGRGVLSDDGSVVALELEGGLLPGDENFADDVYVLDDALELASRADPAAAGTPTAAALVLLPPQALDAAGRHALFFSTAANLVAPATPAGLQLYTRDRLDGRVRRVTHAAGDPATPYTGAGGIGIAHAISGDGEWIAFDARGDASLLPGFTPNGATQLWLRHRASGELLLVSHAADAPLTPGNGTSGGLVQLSFDGRFVAFTSRATTLVSGQTGPVQENLFVYDRIARRAQLVSHAAGAPTTVVGAGARFALARGGSRIAFTSLAAGVVAGVTDANGAADVFLHEIATGANRLVSRAHGGAQAGSAAATDPAISDDGRVVAFRSTAVDLAPGAPQATAFADVFRWRDDDTMELVSHAATSTTQPANADSGAPQLASDGLRLVFPSRATDLVAGFSAPFSGDSLFLRDGGATRLVNRTAAGAATAGNEPVLAFRFARGGRYVLLQTAAANHVAGAIDAGGSVDQVLFDLDDATRTFLATQAIGEPLRACGNPFSGERGAALGDDGQIAVFESDCGDLVRDDINNAQDAFEFLLDEPVRLEVTDVAPAATVVGQPYVVSVRATALLGVPAGMVAVTDGGGGACNVTLDAAGNGHCQLASATAGAIAVNVAFSSDAGFADTRIAVVHPVQPAATAMSLGATPSPAGTGVPVALRAELGVVAPGGGTPAGTVDFFDGATPLCDDLPIGVDCVHAFADAGEHALRAVYSGSADHLASEAAATLTVQPSADLSLRILGLPTTIGTQTRASMDVQVDNAGPSAAVDVAVEIDLPADWPVAALGGEGWSCADERCTRATLAPGAAPPLRVEFDTAEEDGSFAVGAALSAASADAQRDNDADTVNVEIDGPPRIDSATPPDGSTEGGYPLQLTGRNFGDAAGQVRLGTQACAVSAWSSTQIVCLVPPGGGAVALQVVQAGTADDRTTAPGLFAYRAPLVTRIAPAVGEPAGGYDLALEGFDFGAAGAQVTIGGADCTDVRHDPLQPHRALRCRVPPGSGAGLAVLVAQSGQAGSGNVAFTYASVEADLQIAKSSAQVEVLARQAVSWTLLATNLGPDPVQDARVVDALPPHLASASWTCTGLAGGACATAAGTGDIDARLDLPAGGSALFVLTARVPRAPLIDVVNTARIEHGASGDPDPGNNTDTETDPMATVFFDDFETF